MSHNESSANGSVFFSETRDWTTWSVRGEFIVNFS